MRAGWIAALLFSFAAVAVPPTPGVPRAAAALGGVPSSVIDQFVRAVLMRELKFTTGELTELQRGRIVRHMLGATAPGEVAVAGAVRIATSKQRFLDALRDIQRFKRSADVLQIGRFSDPPKPGDLDALSVGPDDFDVRHCRVEDCGVRLPAEIIRRLPAEIDLKKPDAQARGAELFKRILFDDVSAYWSGGSGRMTQYDDGDQPIRPIDAFQGLLTGVPAIGVLVPGLPEHLADFPRHRLEGAEDFLYWSKEKFGIAPFITATQVTIVCRTAPTCLAISKDVYSSRYFDASLALTIATDDEGNPGSAFYLIYANRSRASALKGGLSFLRKSIVERRARADLEENLKGIRVRLERER
jgi:hypothetical protein